MYWHCNICEKVIYEKFANNHLRSEYHKRLANSIIRKYIIVKPDWDGETIAEYLRSHYKKHQEFFSIIVVKLLTSSQEIKNI